MKIYLGRANEDAAWARRLAERLRELGVEALDPAGESTWRPEFPIEATEALRAADAIVVLLSPEAMAANWVHEALRQGLAQERYRGRLLPVIVRTGTNVPSMFGPLVCFDSKGDVNAVADEVLKMVRPSARPARSGTEAEHAKSPRASRRGRGGGGGTRPSPSPDLAGRPKVG